MTLSGFTKGPEGFLIVVYNSGLLFGSLCWLNAHEVNWIGSGYMQSLCKPVQGLGRWKFRSEEAMTGRHGANILVP